MKGILGFAAVLLAVGLVIAAAPGGTDDPVFRDVTRQSGIDFRISADMRRLKMIPTMMGGCAFGDYDGDGLPDLYVTNSVPHWGKLNEASCGRLYRNLGGGRFEDATARSGIRACGLGMGAHWADLDGDGRLDLYLTNVGPNTVYWNRGDGTFEEGKSTGLEDPLFSIGAAFVDYDGDGRLDVVVGNYLDSTPEWEAAQPQFQLRVPEDYRGQPSHLYRNEGNRHFRDVTAAAGLAMNPEETKTLGIAVLDYDGDGHPDLFFVNDRVSNRLFRNKGNGTFEETTAEAGAGVLGPRPRAGMGVAVGDPFGAGRPSLFVTNFGASPTASTGISKALSSRMRAPRRAPPASASRSFDGARISRTSTTTGGPTSTRSPAISPRRSFAAWGITRAARRSTSRRAIPRTRRRRCFSGISAKESSRSGRIPATSAG